MELYNEFLPLCRADMLARGWQDVDFVLVTGDAYVDHPSFGAAIIGRVLEAEGFRIGMLSQPDFTTCESFKEYGKPRYGFFIGGGNVDSMVAHYSVAKIRRKEDEYTPGGKAGKRPDRCATVYTRLAKQAYPDMPVILGGLEASLRRFAHYDYWKEDVLPSIMEDSGADIVSFGMGEHQTREIARRLANGEPASSITDVQGTCYLTDFDHLPDTYVECASYRKVREDKVAYAKACRIQMDNQDCVSGKIVVQKQSEKYLVQNLPAVPLRRQELDEVYKLPFTRRYHPSYEALGGIPAIEEVKFSIIQNRGCFGGCNFCAIQLHQGRRVTSRSEASILAELRQLAAAGYREVVLSAISLPSYGLDTGTNLVELVEKCAQVEGIQRIRLGSLDPDMLTPEFIARLAAVEKLCPQYHLSLQSGCTATLRRMRRVYTAEQYAQVVDQLRAAYGSRPVSFTTDCICGFPGETEADFEESCEFLKKIGFLKVHVFPYSRRSGTPAYDFPQQVHEREKQERSRRMNAIAEEVRRAVLAAYAGTEDDVLLETPLSGTLFTGYTRLYVPVVVSAPGHESGQIVHVRLGEYDGERVRAALC